MTKQIIDFLKEKHKTIAIVESCTGGLINYHFSEVSGASSVYLGGVISYQDKIKARLLKINQNIIDKHSAYSFVVLEAMLDGIITLMDCDFAIATSGIAGPSGGNKENPVGSVYIGVKQKNQNSITTKQIFQGARKEIQHQASLFALQFFLNHYVKTSNKN